MSAFKNKLIILILAGFAPYFACAEEFQIIDGTANISGESVAVKDAARSKWQKACDNWKKEERDLNKKNEVIALSCNVPDCLVQDNGTYACTSTASYKLKIAGTMTAQNPPAVAPTQPVPEVVEQAPPEVIVEPMPVPRPGFVWAVGYWGWWGHGHRWYPGHWIAARPGFVWIGHSWVHRGRGWHLQEGHWGHSHGRR